MSPEFFVVASSLVLGCVLILLTVITQLQVHSVTTHGLSWTTLRDALYNCLRLARPRSSSSRQIYSRDGHQLGKRARRTERRRQRRALTKNRLQEHDNKAGDLPANDTHTSQIPRPSPGLDATASGSRSYYIQHCCPRKEEERSLLAARLTSAHYPCSGCRIVSAKKNCSYNCCARCCRTQTKSVCRAHGTGYQAAVEAVEGAVRYKYLEFDLSYGHLKICPPRVTTIGKQLVTLNLSNNRLSSLPEDTGVLSSLRELFLQYNNLTLLPESVCQLHQLVELDVKNNRLTELPRALGRLRRLVILNVTNNRLSRLPTSLGNLTRLEELGLHSNQLTELPDELCNLTSLKVMYSGENRFKGLPSRFGQLMQLQELDVSGCELESLPESLSCCISIITLWLSNNKLHTLPVHMGYLQQLKELHVRNNKLMYLPVSIEQLHLYTFTAQNNSFIDELTAQEMCHTPNDTVPPLMEVAARAVVSHDIAWDSTPLPLCLREMLSHPKRCSLCTGPFFNFFSSHVTFKTFGVFYRVPLCLYVCSPHLKHCTCLQ